MPDPTPTPTPTPTPSPAPPPTPPATPTPDTPILAGAEYDWVPEKYRVVDAVEGQAGKFNLEASAKKLAEAYSHAEKRIGAGDMRPKAIEDYKVNLPEQYKDVDLSNDAPFKAFLAEAHTRGFTQGQLDLVVNRYFENLTAAANAWDRQDREATMTTLKSVWKDDATVNTNIKAARSAATTLAQKAGIDVAEVMSELGSRQTFIRLMASLAPELGEDAPPTPTGGVTGNDEQIAALRANPAYNDARHPEHAVVMQKLNAAYARKYPKRA